MKNRTLVVAAREFVSTVTSKGYLLTTFGMPVITALIGAIGAIPGVYLASKEATRAKGPFVIVDRSGLLAEAKPSEIFLRAPDLEAARALVRDGKVRAAIDVPQDYLARGEIAIYEDAKGGELAGRADPGGALRGYLVQGLLAGKVDDGVRARVERPLAASARFRLQPDGTFKEEDFAARMSKLGLPIAFTVFLLLAMFTSAGYLMQGVAEEKENRVLEVILSAVTARELLTGKLLGLGGAGLLQLAIWGAGIVTPAARFLPFVEVRASIVAIGVAYFVLGYLCYGSLVLAFGSLGGNYRESQQWSAVFTLAFGALPVMFLSILIDEPGGTIARVLSLVPPTSPICMTTRAALGPVGPLDLAISMGLLVAAVAASLAISARVYRAGTLMTGSKVSLRDVWRVLRTSER